MKNIFVVFVALILVLMAVDVCAKEGNRISPGECLYEEVVDKTGSAQREWDQAEKNADVEGSEDDDEEEENEEEVG